MSVTRDLHNYSFQYFLSERTHHYGKNVHLIADPMLESLLARLCDQSTEQPVINELITSIYSGLLKTVVNHAFPKKVGTTKTRMIDHHPEAEFEHSVIDPETQVVSVNLARAGTVPSHICYSALNYFINPKRVRQDHISIARQTGDHHQVTGSHISGHKIGGSVQDAIVLFPDPMGATGSTLVETLDVYKKHGKAQKWIALHCIVTPEYLKKVTTQHPDLEIYAVRLDRGLSDPQILSTIPGTHWDQEKGLNPSQYIVPGGGGFGEILNNAFV